MDQLNLYRGIVREALSVRRDLMRSQPLRGEEIVCVLDAATDNYLLIRLGRHAGARLYSVTLHVRLVDCRVVIEQDWTDDFLTDIVEAGINRKDIVLAFTPPELRDAPEVVAA